MRYFLSPSLRPLPDFPSPLHSDLLSGLASLSLPSFTLRNSETVSLIHRNARAGPGPQERRRVETREPLRVVVSERRRRSIKGFAKRYGSPSVLLE